MIVLGGLLERWASCDCEEVFLTIVGDFSSKLAVPLIVVVIARQIKADQGSSRLTQADQGWFRPTKADQG